MDPTQGAGVALSLILTEVFKPWVPAKFYPLVALLVGILWMLLNNVPTTVADVGSVVVQGATAGLIAAGVYATAKHVQGTKLAPPPAKSSAPAK